MAVPLFFKYICDVAKPLVSGYDDHGISHLDHILTTGNADAAVAVQASHQKILAEIQSARRDDKLRQIPHGSQIPVLLHLPSRI